MSENSCESKVDARMNLRQRLVVKLGLDPDLADEALEDLLDEDLLEIEECLDQVMPSTGKEDRPRVPLQSPPRPAGAQPDDSATCSTKHTVNVCSDQAGRESPRDGQRARQDSNLQPSDSKSALSGHAQCLDSSPQILDSPTDIQEDSLKTRGFPIPALSGRQYLDAALPSKPQPTGTQDNA